MNVVTPAKNQVNTTPLPVAHTGMWTGFIYILFFISLYTLASGMAGVFHAGVEKMYPGNDAKGAFSYLFDFYGPEVIRGYIASLIVSLPVFVTLGFILSKQLRIDPNARNLRSRKLLIYITLIVTFLILLSQITSTVFSFLNGNITGNSIGHFFVTLVIAGGIFTYFINEVKHDSKI